MYTSALWINNMIRDISIQKFSLKANLLRNKSIWTVMYNNKDYLYIKGPIKVGTRS